MLNKISYLSKDTLITLFDGSYKEISELTGIEVIKVWDFDNGVSESSNILFISGPLYSNEYILYTFNDGSTLKVIDKCFIFDKELGIFTKDLEIGSKTINDVSEEVILVNKEIVSESIEYYGLVTKFHMNTFLNKILTSCEFNNLYPIENMTFVKQDRETKNRADFLELDANLYKSFRISEQPYTVDDLKQYVIVLKEGVNFDLI